MSDYLDQVGKESNLGALLKIIEEDRPGAARIVAALKNVAPEVLARLAVHGQEMVRVLVARNLKTPVDILKAMTLDTNVAIRDSARFSLGRLGRPKMVVPVETVAKEEPVEDVVKKLKKEEKNKKRKNRRKGRR